MSPHFRLTPQDPFPEDLKKLGFADLQILESRLLLELEEEIAHGGGPEPETEFRLEEVREELDGREPITLPAGRGSE